jgi:allantoinase
VSSEDCLPLLAEARARGLPVTAETCPHYLTLAASDVPDGATLFKCAPPIRSATNANGLWSGLEAGVLDLVASDHSPCPPGARAFATGDFFEAWGGIASLQLGASLVWTRARKRAADPARLAEWMSAGPARLAGLQGRKGSVAAGFDADLVIFDPEAEFVVEASGLHDRHRATPYLGMRLGGVVRKTILGGRLVFADGAFVGDRSGRIISAGDRREP